MQLIKQKTQFGINVILQDNDKHLAITFGGNGDLYWSLHSSNVNDNNSFVITKENYGLYSLFQQLFRDIEVEYDKNKSFSSDYNELYDSNNKTITWYSDEVAHDVANILSIRKVDDTFEVEFYTQPYIDGYEEDFHSSHYIPIRFRNSGSSYFPFNMIFMRMYSGLKEIDDVNDVGHQMHVEEYLYQKKKVKTIVENNK